MLFLLFTSWLVIFVDYFRNYFYNEKKVIFVPAELVNMSPYSNGAMNNMSPYSFYFTASPNFFLLSPLSMRHFLSDNILTGDITYH